LRVNLVVPIIVSILILGSSGIQGVFSEIIDLDFVGNVEVGPGESTTITDGAIVEGNVIVDDGEVTINADAIIVGNVEVTNGGSLTIDGATVVGNVVVNGGISITITDSNVGGNVEITDSDDVIVSGNTINGNIVSENTTGCNVFDNDVGGNLEPGDCITGNLRIFVNDGDNNGFSAIQCEVWSGKNGCPFVGFGPVPFVNGTTDQFGNLSFNIDPDLDDVTVVCDLSGVGGVVGWWYFVDVPMTSFPNDPFDFNINDGTNMCCPVL